MRKKEPFSQKLYSLLKAARCLIPGLQPIKDDAIERGLTVLEPSRLRDGDIFGSLVLRPIFQQLDLEPGVLRRHKGVMSTCLGGRHDVLAARLIHGPVVEADTMEFLFYNNDESVIAKALGNVPLAVPAGLHSVRHWPCQTLDQANLAVQNLEQLGRDIGGRPKELRRYSHLARTRH